MFDVNFKIPKHGKGDLVEKNPLDIFCFPTHPGHLRYFDRSYRSSSVETFTSTYPSFQEPVTVGRNNIVDNDTGRDKGWDSVTLYIRLELQTSS